MGSGEKTGKPATESSILIYSHSFSYFYIGNGTTFVGRIRAGRARELIRADATAGVVDHEISATIAT